MEQKPLLDSSDSDDEHERERLRYVPLYAASADKGSFDTSFNQLAKLVKKGSLEKLKEVLKYRNIQLSDSSGTTILHVAAASDNKEVMSLLLRHKRVQALLNRQDQTGASPVVTAVQTSSHRTLELLCSHGADTTKVLAKSGETVLHIAALRFDTKAIKIVLKYNSSPDLINRTDRGGDTPLTEAVKVKSPVFNTLLQVGADITLSNPENGRTLLHVAVAYNRQSMLKRIMVHPDASIDFAEVKDVQGETALMIAVKLQQLELIKILTSTFGKLNGINFMNQESILHIAISNNRPDILKHLLHSTFPTSVDYPDIEQRTPILYAAELNNAQCLQDLIENGADYHVTNSKTGETLLHVIARKHSNSTLPFLMNLSYITWFFSQKDYDGNTPYMTAIKYGNDIFLRAAFKIRKIDLCECNREGETPTYYTIKHGFPNVLLTLLLSPKYYSFARYKQDPVELNDPEVVLKAEVKGDIYATDVYILLKKVIQYPLVSWFPPNLIYKSKYNRSLFHACALGGNLECLEFLFEFYRLFAPKFFLDDFDTAGTLGNTPALFAAQCGIASVSCLYFFVAHGADLAAKNNDGLSVIQAIFLYNPDASDVFITLFNKCVTAEKEHYFSDKLSIKVDFSILCPKGEHQMKVVSVLFNETNDINDRRKVLQHPIIVVFLKRNLEVLHNILHFRFFGTLIMTIAISLLVPPLYIVDGNPEDNYGSVLYMIMKLVFFFIDMACIFHIVLKLPPVMNREVWFTDAIALVPPVSLTALIMCGKSFYFAAELAATLILSSWMCVLVFGINIYSKFSYQIAVFFRLLHSISKQLIVLTVIIFAFALSFFCIYNQDERFYHLPTSFIYTFTVMLPGFMSDLPTFEKEYFKNTPERFHFIVECIVLGAFLVMAITGFVNMLVGLAVRGGQNLEIDGMIFQNHHKAHYLAGIHYWFRSKLCGWLIKKNFFKCLKDFKKRVQTNMVFDIYDDKYKEICDSKMVRELRSIIFKRHKSKKQFESECILAADNLEDVFHDPFGYLPGATDQRSSSEEEEANYLKESQVEEMSVMSVTTDVIERVSDI